MNRKLLKALAIGDGCIQKPMGKCRNSHLVIAHCMRQKEYLLWKRDLLTRMGFRCHVREYETVVNPQTGKRGTQVWLQTNLHPVLTELRSKLYPKENGFQRGFLSDLGPRELAVIFMDDGTTLTKKRNEAKWNGKRWLYPHKPYISAFRFCLQSHGRRGCEQFVRFLKKRYGWDATVMRHRHHFVVHIARTEDKRMFRNIIRRYIHPTMRYKLEGRLTYRSSQPRRRAYQHMPSP